MNTKNVFVVMPFGIKKPMRGYSWCIKGIDFDKIYNDAIKPAIEELDLIPIRADEEEDNGIIHELMYERLVCSNIVIVDITNHNPNVFYELGFRHCARPFHTIVIYDKKHQIPFDISMIRALPYELVNGKITTQSANDLKENLKKRIKGTLGQKQFKDSPAFSLIDDFPCTDLNPSRIKIYNENIDKCEHFKKKLKNINNDIKLKELVVEIENLDFPTSFLMKEIIDAHKHIKDWNNLIEFLKKHMHDSAQNVAYIMKELAFSYNKRGNNNDRQQAKELLEQLKQNIGETCEVYGLLGSVNKELMLEAKTEDEKTAYLNKSITNYRIGYYYDTTNYYTGINLATLYLYKNDASSLSELNKLLPVLIYNIELNDYSNSEYWILATAYELYVHCKRYDNAEKILGLIKALDKKPSLWELETTLKNLKLIKEIYESCKYEIKWYNDFVDFIDLFKKREVIDVMD